MRKATQGLNKNSNSNNRGVQQQKTAQQQNQQLKPNTLKKPAAQSKPQNQKQPASLNINNQHQRKNQVAQKNQQVLTKGANQISKGSQKQQGQNKITSQQLRNQNINLQEQRLTKQFNTVKLLYLRKVLSQKQAKNKNAQLFSKLPLLMSKYEIFPNFGIKDIPNKWNLKPGQKHNLQEEEEKNFEALQSY